MHPVYPGPAGEGRVAVEVVGKDPNRPNLITRLEGAGSSGKLSFPSSAILRQLANRLLTGWVLKLLGNKGKSFKPMLYNTINPTIVQGGHKINVIPSEITIQLDGRILPGFTPHDLIAEIKRSMDPGITSA